MGKYFTIEELSRSETAIKENINNTPNAEQIANLNALIDNVLDPLRHAYGKPLIVNSGFRCDKLNKLVGGVKNSHHRCENGYAAADITTRNKRENKVVFDLAQQLNLPYCELGNESNYSWIHISYNPHDIRREVFIG